MRKGLFTLLASLLLAGCTAPLLPTNDAGMVPGDNGQVLTPDTVATSCQQDPTATCYSMNYAWEFKGKSWTWSASIPKSTYDYFASQRRPRDPLQFADLASDSRDDQLVSDIVGKIRQAASQEGYSEYDTVSFALAFVQSLRYTTDEVSAGKDEYPRYPVETLVFEGGDCEDVSILGAALVTAMGYGAALLIFDNAQDPSSGHAALGVAGGSLEGSYYEHNGYRYYYAEMTHSGFELGEVPDSIQGDQAYVVPVKLPTLVPSSSPPVYSTPLPLTSVPPAVTTTYLVQNRQIAVPAGSAYWYAFQLSHLARVEYSYRVIDDSTENVGIIEASNRAEFLDGESVPVWAYHTSVQAASDGATIGPGTFDLLFVCRNVFADCDLTYSLWSTG